MPYISEKGASIFRRLFTRFLLKSTGVAVAQVGDVITPITDADSLLKTPKLGVSATLDISGAAGWTTAATVPAGKRWRIRYFWKTPTTAATRVSLFETEAARVAATGQVDLTLGNTTETAQYCDFTLNEGNVLALQNTNNAGDNARVLRYLYEEEDSY